MVLYDSFGKGSLKAEQREHTFSADYVNSPVFNNLISICLIKIKTRMKFFTKHGL